MIASIAPLLLLIANPVAEAVPATEPNAPPTESVTSGPIISTDAPPTKETRPDPLDKKVCKRVIETGSQVKGKKVCLTKREWNAVADDNRQRWQEQQENGGRIIQF
jgi:hypothetical protein